VATIIVGKLEVARRQLETAALLYFNDLDLVSVHALVAAAYKVVETIAKKRGRSTLTQRSILDFLTDDLVKEARQAMRSPQNFFKHADKDSEERFEFDPAFYRIPYARCHGYLRSDNRRETSSLQCLFRMVHFPEAKWANAHA
jgi:hypothetical protein